MKKKKSSLKFSLLIFNFRPKIKVFSKKKKKRSSPKFGNYFFAVDHRHLPKFSDFAQIFITTCFALNVNFFYYFNILKRVFGKMFTTPRTV